MFAKLGVPPSSQRFMIVTVHCDDVSQLPTKLFDQIDFSSIPPSAIKRDGTQWNLPVSLRFIVKLSRGIQRHGID